MKFLKNKLFQNIGLYTVLNFINSAIPFLLLPILTRHLSKAEYGIVDLFYNLNFILLPLIGLNIGSSVIRFYFDKDEINLNNFIQVVLSFLITFGLVILGVLFVLVSVFDFTPLGKDVPKYVLIFAIIYALSSQIIEILLSLLRAQEKPLFFGLLRISKSITDLGLSVFFIVVLNYGWEGRVVVSTIIAFVFALFVLLIIRKYYKVVFSLEKEYLKKALNYSTPLILHSLSGYITSFADRFIILHLLGIEKVGLYAVAYQVGLIMSFVSNSINQAYTPFLFKKLKEHNSRFLNKLKTYNFYYLILLLFITIIIYLTVPFIYKYLIGKEYKVSYSIVLFVLLGYFFNGVYKIYSNFFFYYKSTLRLAVITAGVAVCNIFFSFVLVQRSGILGASLATSLSFFLLAGLVYYQYKKRFEHKINS